MSYDFAVPTATHLPLDMSTPSVPLSVLLALDGSRPSESAARVTLELAERRMALVQVLQIIDTRPVPIPPPLDVALAVADSAYGEAIQEERQLVVSSTLERLLGKEVSWPVAIKLGQPSHVILQEALQQGATLITVGLRHHGAVERATHNDTVHEILRATTIPVLAVTEQQRTLPHHVVVGMDFSRASIDAARVALTLMGDGGTMTLAYVAPAFAFGIEEGEQLIRQLGVAAAFEKVHASLAPSHGIAIDDVILDGTLTRNIAATLRAHVDSVNADLVALGARRHGRLERWIVGSVTADFTREGRHSLLAVPAMDQSAPTATS
ncbi:MAG: universal stress protein [Gemmatimonadaceae bacterium]|nr:universal stress protein [Gemmatimonadaceae bacterium]